MNAVSLRRTVRVALRQTFLYEVIHRLVIRERSFKRRIVLCASMESVAGHRITTHRATLP